MWIEAERFLQFEVVYLDDPDNCQFELVFDTESDPSYISETLGMTVKEEMDHQATMERPFFYELPIQKVLFADWDEATGCLDSCLCIKEHPYDPVRRVIPKEAEGQRDVWMVPDWPVLVKLYHPTYFISR